MPITVDVITKDIKFDKLEVKIFEANNEGVHKAGDIVPSAATLPKLLVGILEY